jgi:hypothetical protein
MSARPERRRSSLTGASPLARPPVEPAAAEAPAPAPTREPQAAAPAAPASTTVPAVDAAPTGADKPRSKYPPKVSFYQSTEDTDRIRGAIMSSASRPSTTAGSRSRASARELPQGRPMGE